MLNSSVNVLLLLLVPPLAATAQEPARKTTLPSGAWFMLQPADTDTSVLRFRFRLAGDSISGTNPLGLAIRGRPGRGALPLSYTRKRTFAP